MRCRVMTSTLGGDNGQGFGWINYKLIEQGKRAEAMQFAQEYSDKLAAMSVSGAVQKRLGELAKVERHMWLSGKIVLLSLWFGTRLENSSPLILPLLVEYLLHLVTWTQTI